MHKLLDLGQSESRQRLMNSGLVDCLSTTNNWSFISRAIVIHQDATRRALGVVELTRVGHAKKKPDRQCKHPDANNNQKWQDVHVKEGS